MSHIYIKEIDLNYHRPYHKPYDRVQHKRDAQLEIDEAYVDLKEEAIRYEEPTEDNDIVDLLQLLTYKNYIDGLLETIVNEPYSVELSMTEKRLYNVVDSLCIKPEHYYQDMAIKYAKIYSCIWQDKEKEYKER